MTLLNFIKSRRDIFTFFLYFLASSFTFIFPLFSVILIRVYQIDPKYAFLIQAFVYLASGFFQIKVGKETDKNNYSFVIKTFFIFLIAGLIGVGLSPISRIFIPISLALFVVCISVCLTTFSKIVIASVKESREGCGLNSM